MANGVEKTAAEIERDISSDRQRIEEKLTAIQERLTPGQLVDEALGFMKARGAGDYFVNLGRSVKTNPVPVALMGLSMAWLMAAPNGRSVEEAEDDVLSADDYPLATVTGTVRRTRSSYAESGQRYSEFGDDGGRRFKALTDDAGRRAGHFMDDTGQYFRGFADSTGRRIDEIRDEAGSMLDEASGWASDTWQSAKASVRGMKSSLSDAASGVKKGSSSAMSSLKEQSSQLNELILRQFRDQPLVGGALAFAVGAAIGAALPHTEREDELLGEAADDVRRKAVDQASDLIDKGEETARNVYDRAAAVAADVHDAAKDRILEESSRFRTDGDGSGTVQRTPN